MSEVAEETVEVWKVHFHWTSPWTESTWELRNWFQRTQPAYQPIRNSNSRNLEPIFTNYLEWIAFERSLDLEAAIDCKHSTKWKAWRTKLFFFFNIFQSASWRKSVLLDLAAKKQHTKLCNEEFYQSTTNVSPSIGETATMFFIRLVNSTSLDDLKGIWDDFNNLNGYDIT